MHHSWHCYDCLSGGVSGTWEHAESAVLEHIKTHGHAVHACFMWEDCARGCVASVPFDQIDAGQ